jgi:RNA polymerase sigma factor (sigma-70 family)
VDRGKRVIRCILTEFRIDGLIVQGQRTREEAEALFLEQLETIERITRFVSNRAGLRDATAQDFASYVHVRLIENDYATLRNFEQRCSVQTFLTLVIKRFLLDYRIHLWGKWHPSAEAKRLGPVAVELEKNLYRDNQPIEEALQTCRKIDPNVTLQQLAELAARLPRRQAKPRAVNVDDVGHELKVTAEAAHEAASTRERETLSRSVSDVVRTTLQEFPEEDRVLLRLRFGGDLTIPQIARILNADEKPLYRRIQRCLRELRQRLEHAGLTGKRLEEILSGARANLDFDLQQESDGTRPSKSNTDTGDSSGGSD